MSANDRRDESESEDDFNPAPAEASDDEGGDDDLEPEQTATKVEGAENDSGPVEDEDNHAIQHNGRRRRSPSRGALHEELDDSATKRSPGPSTTREAAEKDEEEDIEDEADENERRGRRGRDEEEEDEEEDEEDDDDDDDVQEVR
jgi:transcription elongation factor SPT5